MVVMENYDTPVQAVEPFLWTFGDGTAVLLSSLPVSYTHLAAAMGQTLV